VLYFQFLNKQPLKIEALKSNFNMSPTHSVPVVYAKEGSREIDAMQWGLIPEWSPEFSTKLSAINACSEAVFES